MESRTKFRILISVLFFIGVVYPTIGVLCLGIYPGANTATEVLQAISIAVSTSLSAALVYLYFQQKEVMESQIELKEAELSGNLYLNNISYEDRKIVLDLSNLSGSEISELVVKTEIFPKEIGEREIKVLGKELTRVENESQLGRVSGIAPREQNVEFSGTPSVYYLDEDDNEMLPELTFFTTQLRDWGVEEVKCRMWVEGKDQLGQTVKTKIFPWDKRIKIDTERPVHEEPNLEEVFRHTTSVAIEEESNY